MSKKISDYDEEIEELIESTIYSPNKNSAKPHIKRLINISESYTYVDFEGRNPQKLKNAIRYASEASGRVGDDKKKHHAHFARSDFQTFKTL